MACTSTCPTQDCPNWGACVRNKGLAIAAVDSTTNGYANGGDQ